MNVEIERVSEDGLTRKLWRFYFFLEHPKGAFVRLNYFSEQSRKSTRHKFRSGRVWDTMDERAYHSTMARAEVPEPKSVILEAIQSVKFEYRPLEKTGAA